MISLMRPGTSFRLGQIDDSNESLSNCVLLDLKLGRKLNVPQDINKVVI